jgi:hypothetical protein
MVMYRTELLICGVPTLILFGIAFLLIYLQKKEENKERSRYNKGKPQCKHNWGFINRTESVGLGSSAYNHYVCSKCGEKKATPTR